MVRRDLSISEVLHKGLVAVDEDGTEAAAATAVVVSGANSIPETPIPFVVDRPFLFAIYDEPTGELPFMGRAVELKKWRPRPSAARPSSSPSGWP